jgi:hypothetical protein
VPQSFRERLERPELRVHLVRRSQADRARQPDSLPWQESLLAEGFAPALCSAVAEEEEEEALRAGSARTKSARLE